MTFKKITNDVLLIEDFTVKWLGFSVTCTEITIPKHKIALTSTSCWKFDNDNYAYCHQNSNVDGMNFKLNKSGKIIFLTFDVERPLVQNTKSNSFFDSLTTKDMGQQKMLSHGLVGCYCFVRHLWLCGYTRISTFGYNELTVQGEIKILQIIAPTKAVSKMVVTLYRLDWRIIGFVQYSGWNLMAF